MTCNLIVRFTNHIVETSVLAVGKGFPSFTYSYHLTPYKVHSLQVVQAMLSSDGFERLERMISM